MKRERWEELERTGAKLEPEERRAGWHYCPEFDYLLTQGELRDEDGSCSFCGFDGSTIDLHASDRRQ